MTRARAALAVAAALALGAVAAPAPSAAAASGATRAADVRRPSAEAEVVARLIVRTRDGSAPPEWELTSAAAVVGGGSARVLRRLATGDLLLALPHAVPLADARRAAAALAALPGVVRAEPDARLLPAVDSPLTPDDPYFAQQWDLWDSLATSPPGGFSVKAPYAWSRGTGDPSVVVAVLDTGITPHPDLAGRIVPGYDFVSADSPGVYLTANDGDGRDPDPSDPGDWITAAENAGTDATHGFFQGCGGQYADGHSDSTWHGTHVAGTIAAVQGNATGITGIAPGVRIQPVRVLGKCGGSLSDITDAIVWAAGGSVAGVPPNPTPATVINLSLGGSGACDPVTQQAIDVARAHGATVVVASGNDGQSIMPGGTTATGAVSPGSTPADCRGVIAVTASTRQGHLAAYSDVGTVPGSLTIAAPGGDGTPGGANIVSTVNEGLTTPVDPGDPAYVPGADYRAYAGTSMATPHVAAAVALLQSFSGRRLTPDQVAARLAASAAPFPADAACTAECGVGLLDIGRMLLQYGVTVTAPTIYPFRDGYLDTTRFLVTSSIPAHGLVRLRDARDRVVRDLPLAVGTAWAPSWDGRDAHGARVPVGTYRVEVMLTDREDRLTTVATRTVRVLASQAHRPTVHLSSRTAYPLAAPRPRTVTIDATAVVPSVFTWRFTTPRGVVVLTRTFSRRIHAIATFAGLDARHRVLPAGVYLLVVTARGGEGVPVSTRTTVVVAPRT